MSADETIEISVPVKNTGTIKGKEILQLYVKDLKSSEMRPEKELKNFAKVELNPGEEKVVTFKLDKTALQFYSDIKKEWVA